MAYLSLAAIISTVVASVATAVAVGVGTILCGPCSNWFKSCMDDFFTPPSEKERDDLVEMRRRITDMSPSVDGRGSWLSNANNIMAMDPSSAQNDDLQSCCLIRDKCLKCGSRGKVKELLKKGNGIIIKYEKLQPEKVVSMPEVPVLESDSVAAMTVQEVMPMLRDDKVQRIGIWGSEEIDRTNALKTLNNELWDSPLFSFVIFISVRVNAGLIYVQRAIAERLKLQVEETTSSDTIADRIREKLLRKKFLLIMDNVSESINFASIGIPENCGMSKIVLASRNRRVCELMDAKPIINVNSFSSTKTWKPSSGKFVMAVKVEKLAIEVEQQSGRPPQILVNWADFKLDLVQRLQPSENTNTTQLRLPFSKILNSIVEIED